MIELSDGYFDVPAGKIAAVVTDFTMTAPPLRRPDPASVQCLLEMIERPQPEPYRALFRRIGAPWLWFSRRKMSADALQAIIGDAAVEIYRRHADGHDVGLLELDFRESGSCELAFFGVVPALIGTGAGRWLMNRALDIVWSRTISRFCVHSCTLDHPAAVGFYMRSGFRPVRRRIEIADDPRLSGIIETEVAPGVPLL
jgi:GNAT superfamily N-acetyltransferase